jgi:hypothetical protein
MWVLQILPFQSLRLGLLENPKNYNNYIVNIQYKCRSMGECNSHTFNYDYSLCTPIKYFHHIFKCVDIVIPSSKNAPSIFLERFKCESKVKTTKKTKVGARYLVRNTFGGGGGRGVLELQDGTRKNDKHLFIQMDLHKTKQQVG